MCYTLPKIWQGRIQKYWDRTIPSNYPNSSSEFSLTFSDPEEADAVKEFEADLFTEESVVNDFLPEGTYATVYDGVYNVIGTPGELTLLSPQKVSTDNIIVMHYGPVVDDEAEEGAETENSWQAVDNIQIQDGYVWGIIDSFCPIAIIEFRKEMHLETSVNGLKGTVNAIVCEGNDVLVEEREDGTFAINRATGYEIELDKASIIIGGSIDGSPIESTHVTVLNTTTNAKVNKIVGGSIYVDEGFATVGEINVYIDATKTGSLTGSLGAVRTNKVNYNLNNATLGWFLGCGESYANVNPQYPDLGSRAWAKEVNMKMTNVSVQLAFLGQNCEYFYVDNTKAEIVGGRFDWLICGGSNSRTNKTEVNVKDASIGIFQTTNRGNVADATATFTGCTVENLFVGGDPTDSTVTGTTTKLRYEINESDHGSYVIKNGTENGEFLTADDVQRIVDTIKVPRTGDITIDADIKAMLGNKYIVK